MRKLVDVGKCKDVVLFVAGHGTPAEGPGATEEPTVVLSSRATSGSVVIDEAVTATDLIDLVEGYRGKATFKYLINSCFSGRFVEELAPQPGVELVATASQADDVSYQAVEGDTSRTTRTRPARGSRASPTSSAASSTATSRTSTRSTSRRRSPTSSLC